MIGENPRFTHHVAPGSGFRLCLIHTSGVIQTLAPIAGCAFAVAAPVPMLSSRASLPEATFHF